MAWTLTDLLAYFLTGVSTLALASGAIVSPSTLAESVEHHVANAAVAAVVFGYPVGFIANSFGRLIRELMLKLRKDRRRNQIEQMYTSVDGETAALVRRLLYGDKAAAAAARGLSMELVSIAALLAEHYLPGEASAQNRRSSVFAFSVSLLGGTTIGMLGALLGGAVRIAGALSGPWWPYLLGLLAGVFVLTVEEYAIRSQNQFIAGHQLRIAIAVGSEAARAARSK